MSGTSLDGVDAVVAEFTSGPPRLRGRAHLPYPDALRAELLALNRPGHDELRRAARLSVELAELYAGALAAALRDAGISPSAVAAVGCHGQTVRHRPDEGYSLQLNHAAWLAERSGITVVADFRNRDIAAGGEGAPLVPAFHDALWRLPDRHRVVLNIGGIANLTDLAPGRTTRGFDTGPGNMLMDGWAERHLGQRFDAGGAWAASAAPDPVLLDTMLAHPFLARHAPKSCGREEFSLDWLDALLPAGAAPARVQASLLELSAHSIAAAVRNECGAPHEVLLCGGGAHNTALRARLAALLPQSTVATTAAFGVSPDDVEALAFAWLARQCLLRQPGNLPAVTGACGARILGAIYPA